MFIVEKGTPGFKVGRALDKTGWRSSDTAELVFEDCRVPAENVLGEPNRGFYSIMANFQTERLVIGAMAMAEAREAIRLTFDYVNQRTAFGAPLWDKQAIRQRLSRRLAEVEAARQLVHHTAWLDAQGTDCVAQVSMVKALAGDLVNEVLYDCVQFHGGMGFVRETAVERMARDARVQSIGGGASEVMLEEVAKRFGQCGTCPTDRRSISATTRNETDRQHGALACRPSPRRIRRNGDRLAAALSLARPETMPTGRCGPTRDGRASRWRPGSARCAACWRASQIGHLLRREDVDGLDGAAACAPRPGPRPNRRRRGGP